MQIKNWFVICIATLINLRGDYCIKLCCCIGLFERANERNDAQNEVSNSFPTNSSASQYDLSPPAASSSNGLDFDTLKRKYPQLGCFLELDSTQNFNRKYSDWKNNQQPKPNLESGTNLNNKTIILNIGTNKWVFVKKEGAFFYPVEPSETSFNLLRSHDAWNRAEEYATGVVLSFLGNTPDVSPESRAQLERSVQIIQENASRNYQKNQALIARCNLRFEGGHKLIEWINSTNPGNLGFSNKLINAIELGIITGYANIAKIRELIRIISTSELRKTNDSNFCNLCFVGCDKSISDDLECRKDPDWADPENQDCFPVFLKAFPSPNGPRFACIKLLGYREIEIKSKVYISILINSIECYSPEYAFVEPKSDVWNKVLDRNYKITKEDFDLMPGDATLEQALEIGDRFTQAISNPN